MATGAVAFSLYAAVLHLNGGHEMAKKTYLEKRLAELTALHDKGVITDEEYASQREAVIANPTDPARFTEKSGRFPFFRVGCLGIVALVVIVIVVSVAVNSGGSDDTASQPAAAVANGGSGAPTAAKVGTNKGDVHVPYRPNASGSIAAEGNSNKMSKVTILQAKDNIQSTNQFEHPGEGNKYWGVQVLVENVGTAEVSSLDWKLRDSGDLEHDNTSVVGAGQELEFFYNLTPGGKTTGWVFFEIPANASPKWLRADPNPFLKNDLYFDFQ
jgi:hypothetical protein